MTLQKRFAIGCCVCLLGWSGCGSSHVPVHPTRGQLTINGQPASGAVVGLHPVGEDFDPQGSRPAAQVQSDGSFTFSTFAVQDGVPAGQYIVTVFWPQNPAGPDLGEDRLQNQFSSPKSSTLRVTVDPGDNDLDPIVLRDVPVLDSGIEEPSF